jgi:hypothetical protein
VAKNNKRSGRKVVVEPSHDHVIEAAHRFKPQAAAAWKEAEIRRAFNPTYNLLPFVTRSPISRACDVPLSFWNDVPTRGRKSDHARGRDYARLALAAIAADDSSSRPLEQTFRAIIKQVAAQPRRGRKRTRALPPAVDGFLWEMSNIIRDAAAVSQLYDHSPAAVCERVYAVAQRLGVPVAVIERVVTAESKCTAQTSPSRDLVTFSNRYSVSLDWLLSGRLDLRIDRHHLSVRRSDWSPG